uniref:Uncharacterized protein n=1 Tax=Physcomitrium patens TaxID=3218 RepID=A0A2K1L8K0_PHYPA|nr:hypothetical protein PHYPA_000745 [Physcomitrium patens]
MNYYSKLEFLLNGLDKLTTLITLNFKGYTNLTSLLNELGTLTSLTTLNIEVCMFLVFLQIIRNKRHYLH